jgi:ribose 5-phosphate isomerase A
MSDPQLAAKRAAGERAVAENVKTGMKLGIGSGSTVVPVVEEIARKVKKNELQSIVCIPTSFQSRQLIVENGLVLGDLEQFPVLDVAIDGADECDIQLNCIKGGGGCQTLEKLVASVAKEFVIVADHRKQSTHLGETWKQGIPVEVIPAAYTVIMHRLREIGGNPKLRMAQRKAGPVVTDNGNFLIDVDFGVLSLERVVELNSQLNSFPGVLEHGLFVKMAKRAYFGQQDGTVHVVDPKTDL